MAQIGTKATHMAYPACEDAVVAHVGTEATHVAYAAREAVVKAHMGTLLEQSGAKRRAKASMRCEPASLFAFLPVFREWEEVFMNFNRL